MRDVFVTTRRKRAGRVEICFQVIYYKPLVIISRALKNRRNMSSEM